MESNKENGIYLNGKQQVIDLLQLLPESEKAALLNNIKKRNASMAKELSEQSLSFTDIFKLPDHVLSRIFNTQNSTIVGLALYNCPANFQKKALRIMERANAEQAFNVLNQNLSAKSIECKKAQRRIIHSTIELSRKKIIDL